MEKYTLDRLCYLIQKQHNWNDDLFSSFEEHYADSDSAKVLDQLISDLGETGKAFLIKYGEFAKDTSGSISEGINAELFRQIKQLQPELKYSFDDKGNGDLFADLFKNKIRWNTTARSWYQYDGRIWKEDAGGMYAARLAKDLADCLIRYSTTLTDERQRMGYLHHVIKLGNLRSRNAMLDDARDKYYISADQLDTDDYLLNCQNCVLDLRTFRTMPHDPDQLLSKICNVEYIPGIRCDRWQHFIEEVLTVEPGSDQEHIDKDKAVYLQKIIGYALTGDTREETCYILYGQTTRNGKSTLVETISYMLGDAAGYALNMKPETLAQKQNNDSRQASGDVARLKNCRFLNAAEPPKRMLIDVGLLKTLLGRDTITARFLHQNEFQFVPKFKLFMNTNFLPLITDDTLFSSGRINVISFDRHFGPSDQDKSLKEKLRTPEALSGILNWCLDGLRMYQREGAIPPQSVISATDEYRQSSDKVGNFIAERLEPVPGVNMAAKDVYDEYQRWCRDNGYGQENKGNFYADLRAKGLLKQSGTVAGRTVRGVVPGYSMASDFTPVAQFEIPFK